MVARSVQGAEDPVARGGPDGSGHAPPPATERVPETRVIANLKCHLCARVAGVLEGDRLVSANRLLFRKQGPGEVTRIGNWRELRCQTCGGTLYVDEIEEVPVRKEEPTGEQLFGPESQRGRLRKHRSDECGLSAT
jgi:hypothetical protein